MHLAGRFYPKATYIAFKLQFFYILSALAFPGNRTHDLGIASAIALPFELQESFKMVYLKSAKLKQLILYLMHFNCAEVVMKPK